MKEHETFFVASNGQEYELRYILSGDMKEAKIMGVYMLDDDEDYRYANEMNDLQRLHYLIDLEQQWLKSKGLSLMRFDESGN